MQNASSKKGKSTLSWRQRNRLNLQSISLALGLLAPFVVFLALQNDQTTPAGIFFALLVAVMIILTWAA